MLLTSEQNKLLRRFIKRYSYPCVTYDFMRRRECAHRNMRIVESIIHRQLISSILSRTASRMCCIGDTREQVTEELVFAS